MLKNNKLFALFVNLRSIYSIIKGQTITFVNSIYVIKCKKDESATFLIGSGQNIGE